MVSDLGCGRDFFLAAQAVGVETEMEMHVTRARILTTGVINTFRRGVSNELNFA
jgi:hypothetical protein